VVILPKNILRNSKEKGNNEYFRLKTVVEIVDTIILLKC
jgi:hypothetical protein